MWLVHQSWYRTFWPSKKLFPAYLYSISLYSLFISEISDQLSLIWAFLKFVTNEIIQYVVFCICLLSQRTNDPFKLLSLSRIISFSNESLWIFAICSSIQHWVYVWFLSFFFSFCSGFCHTLKWNSHGFTCVPHPDSPPTSLSTRSL